MTLPQLPPRSPDSHKGDFGRVLLIGGSRGMAGAIGLAGMAALRSGAGLVTLAVPREIQAVVAGYEPSYMTWGLAHDEAGRIAGAAHEALLPLVERADAVALGPGLGRSGELDALVRDLFDTSMLPLVLDADGLNAVAERPLSVPSGPRVLTPHPGEFRRLCPECGRERAEMEEAAIAWAQQHQVVLVLKGHNSLITDGQRSEHNATGNPGMATGGSGDVLTGIIAALLGQGLPAWEAARLGSHLHGLAGDLGVAELGQVALIASDLVRYLPRAFQVGPHT